MKEPSTQPLFDAPLSLCRYYNLSLAINPTTLLISIAAAREGVPFPALVEALMMEFLIEGLPEAGVRLPKPIGSGVSFVGALVIGQAAV